MRTIYRFYICLLLIAASSSCRFNSSKEVAVDCPDSTSIVPPPFELHLKADTFPTSVQAIEGMLHNNTTFDAHFGEEAWLEYYADSSWQQVTIVPPEGQVIIINSIAYGLSAGGRVDFRVYLYQEYHRYKAGRYRVCKKVDMTLYADLLITDTAATDVSWIKSTATDYFEVSLQPNVVSISTDTITLSITNHSSLPIAPYNHYFVTSSAENGYWERYFYPSHTPYLWSKTTLEEEESAEYPIPLISEKRGLYSGQHSLYKGQYYYHPGRYRICKYTTVQVMGEFILSDE